MAADSIAAGVELRHLRSFLMVSQELNITRAAARLHLAQQAVSVQIQQLERALGAPLLVRTSRGVSLTPAGAELAVGARSVVGELDSLAARLRARAERPEPARPLRLACCPYATAPFALEAAAAMEEAIPGLAIDLITVPTLAEELALLRSDEADAAFLWLPAAPGTLRQARVRAYQRAVAVRRGHRLADRASVCLADLAEEALVVPDSFECAEARGPWSVPRAAPAEDWGKVEGWGKVEDCLLAVARGRGVWLAPEPLSRWAPAAPGVSWLPVRDAAPSHLALTWSSRAPEPLLTRLVAELRRFTGWTKAA
ncbi:LysR family transcriptional regulator [Kitasatospora sp. NBC_01287]|uniref:LysR family transcriptional regulator n=1 Tax=Kitasatospora sp. NBC_01287 TaxID=2903573 RepID=UPI0022572E96|nr:LysR family transcriptional regulator [Kitasatospora sp. NBC_01287]MCX4749461.1 LysR family transcriptional regulator [Kitasatospora sp. NBC_01287]